MTDVPYSQQAIIDMIKAMTEFELWLEAEFEFYKDQALGDERPTDAIFNRYHVIMAVVSKYRQCKERIQYDDE